MLTRLALVALVFALASLRAIAAQVTFGGVLINLPIPAGFCELSASNSADNRLLAAMGEMLSKSGNQLLVESADCQQLADWRARKRQFLDDYTQYQTPIASMESSSPPERIQQTCTALRAESEKIVSNQKPDLKARVENALKQANLNEPTSIGVLAEDAAACYGGMIQKFRTEEGDKTQLVVFALTIVKKKGILVYRGAGYTSSDTVTEVLTNLKITVASLYAANK
jgi:hypothetical protein